MTTSHLHGWIPIRVHQCQAQWMVDWCYLGPRRLTEPFFEQTIDACMRQPFNQLFRRQTPIRTLLELQAQQPGLPLHGCIFHMSRCGSTLIAQLLAGLPNTVVLAEAGPIDTILRAQALDPSVTDEQRCLWLQAIVNALGQPRLGTESALVIKFDSWSILDLPLIHRAFPQVPWVFVFRDPVEVLASHYVERGSQMVPSIVDPAVFGVERSAARHMSFADYAAHIVASICAAALKYQEIGNGRLIHYPQLPEIVWLSLLDFFNIGYAPADLEPLVHAARFHAKRRTEQFVQDGAAKQQIAPAALRLAADRYAALYRDLLTSLKARGLRQ